MLYRTRGPMTTSSPSIELTNQQIEATAKWAVASCGRGIPYEEAYSAALEGIAQALHTYSPSRGAKLVTHAMNCARTAVLHSVSDYRRHGDAYVGVYGGKYFRARKLEYAATEEDIRQIADELGIGLDRAKKWWLQLRTDSSANLEDVLSSERTVEDEVGDREVIERLIESAKGESRVTVLRMLIEEPRTTDSEIASRLCLSRERVRQLRESLAGLIQEHK